MKVYSRTYIPRLKDQAFALLGGKRCVLCGFDADERALSFDHIHGGGSRERRGRNQADILRTVLREPERFRVLCLNCNWLAHLDAKGTEKVA